MKGAAAFQAKYIFNLNKGAVAILNKSKYYFMKGAMVNTN